MINPKKSNLELKKQLFKLCQSFVETRRQTVQNSIQEIQEALASETKSSAGDKHETGRAMLQLEREKVGQQLAEIEKLEDTLSKINTTFTSKTIGLGSVVFTKQANYFIAISAGKLDLGSQSFYVISPSTPIGLLMIGKKVGDVVVFREEAIRILNVL